MALCTLRVHRVHYADTRQAFLGNTDNGNVHWRGFEQSMTKEVMQL